MKNFFLSSFLFCVSFFFLLSSFFFLSSSFAQAPSNDNCSGAISFGTLPSPSGCPSGNGAAVSQSGTNVNATSPNPYTYIPDCGTGTTDMAAPALDVWYSFVASGNVLLVNMTGTLANPNVGLYSGNCNSLFAWGCAIGQSNGNLPSTTFDPLTPGQTYYIQVSGNNATDTGNFILTLQNNNDCSDCLQQATLTATPPPVNGTYGTGQIVTFCYQVFDYSQVSSNWLHGVQIKFASGWDTTTLTTNPPPSCSGNGFWAYYPSGITSSSTGALWSAGFYYDYTAGSAGPGNNYGDNNIQDCDPQFCWTISTDTVCIPGISHSVKVNTSSDGESGSWTSAACQDDPETTFEATMDCPSLVLDQNFKQDIKINPNPNSGKFTLLITPFSNEPFDLIIYNILGEIVFKEFEVQEFDNIDISNSAYGIYNLQLIADKFIVNKKLMIN